MTHTRRIGALSALALTLVLAACGTPEDLNVPTLEPQFGSEEDDIGFDVFAATNGRVFVLSEEAGTEYEYDYDYDYYNSYEYERLYLQFYDTSGNFVSTTYIDGASCNWDYRDCSDGDRLKPRGLYADSKGFRYALYSIAGYDDDNYINYYVTKLDASGNNYTYSLGRGSNDSARSVIDIAVDSSGNIYVAKAEYSYDYNLGDGTYTNVVSKYSTTGALQWQRTSTVGTPRGITVSSSGSVYVVGSTGLARYTSTGGLTWTKPGIGEEVIISGSNIYTRYRKDIRKYDGTGKQLWLRSQTGLNTIIFQDMTGDSYGNVYLSGKYAAGGGNFRPMVRKLNSSGTGLWTRTYGTTAYDDARGISTLGGSETYVTGETQGSLAHPNYGGQDAYVRKLNSSGYPVWSR